jgi:hypothetical protein
LRLPRSVSAWNHSAGSTTFRNALLDELEALGSNHPAIQPLLQASLTQTSAVSDSPLSVQLLSLREQKGQILAHLGVFYDGIIAGCSCADDPTPIDTITEHCELLLEIVITTAAARVSLWEPSALNEAL